MDIHASPIILKPIGYVGTDVLDEDVPRKRAEMVSNLCILDEYAEALDGIDEYSHLFVLFWMHKAPPQDFHLKTHPRGREDLPLTGVLATRGRNHPNPIGLAVVELLERQGNRLQVKHLDAFDGSPILDIKPYDPYDVFTDIRVPAWWGHLSNKTGKVLKGA